MSYYSTTCYDLLITLCLEPAEAGTSKSIFGFAEYLTALALMLVVFAISDFRYRYRFQLTRYDAKKVAFFVSFFIGVCILLIDVWFYNEWPIIVGWNDPNNIKFVLGLVFLAQIFYLYLIAFLRPPVFGPLNSKEYFLALRDAVGRGNRDQLAVVSDELGRSAKSIIELAALCEPDDTTSPKGAGFANDILLLLADKRLCSVMVNNSPRVIAEFFRCASDCWNKDIPFGLFARNIGEELVLNENSALHFEDSGYDSGYFGFTKPISKSVFGDFNLVEALANKHLSPLELAWHGKRDINADHFVAYIRAALIFMESYLESNAKRGRSQAFHEILEACKWAVSDLHKINGADGEFWRSDEHLRLEVTVKFVCGVVELLDKYEIEDVGPLKPSKDYNRGIYEQIARLIVKILSAAAAVKEPWWTSWSVQHNTVWVGLFDYKESSAAWKLVKFKVRRLLFDEIKGLGTTNFFPGARLLGLCLNIFGFGEERITSLRSDFYPLRKAILAWTKGNYLALLEEYPNVAAACIQGSVSYDAKNTRLAKTYQAFLGQEPARKYLKLDVPKK